MSGTSIDSADFALCSIRPPSVQLRRFWQVPFPKNLRHRLNAAAQGRSSSHQTAQLHHDLGRFYSAAATAGLGTARLDLVGLHGQTIYHNPGKNSATLQLGEPAYLVEALRVPVISNFRAADIAAGGQGAPLATLFHRDVFGEPGRHICVNNLGGISNVTSIDRSLSGEPSMIAFDTGPGNILIDLAIQKLTAGRRQFDLNGNWARHGKISEPLLEELIEHRYFNQKPPKSTGREVFGEALLEPCLKRMLRCSLSRFDILSTLTELTARSVCLNYRRHLKRIPERVILTGGGANNRWLVDRIRAAFNEWEPSIEIRTCDELGWHCQSVEPAAFALLAYYRLSGQAANLRVTTGARHSVLLGTVAEPQKR